MNLRFQFIQKFSLLFAGSEFHSPSSSRGNVFGRWTAQVWGFLLFHSRPHCCRLAARISDRFVDANLNFCRTVHAALKPDSQLKPLEASKDSFLVSSV